MAQRSRRKFGILRIKAEQVTILLSLLIVLILIGLISFIGVNQTTQPPTIAVQQSQPSFFAAGHHYVPYVISNTGGNTASSVQIQAELRINDDLVESAQQSVDFLSSGEQVDAMLIFEHDPAQGVLTIRSTGFRLP